MSKNKKDPELAAYKDMVGEDNYWREYNNLRMQAKQSKSRYSKLKYINTVDKLNEIKNKYKNGVSKETINEMLGIKE